MSENKNSAWLWKVCGTERGGWAPTPERARAAAGKAAKEEGIQGYQWFLGDLGIIRWPKGTHISSSFDTAKAIQRDGEAAILLWKSTPFSL